MLCQDGEVYGPWNGTKNCPNNKRLRLSAEIMLKNAAEDYAVAGTKKLIFDRL